MNILNVKEFYFNFVDLDECDLISNVIDYKHLIKYIT